MITYTPFPFLINPWAERFPPWVCSTEVRRCSPHRPSRGSFMTCVNTALCRGLRSNQPVASVLRTLRDRLDEVPAPRAQHAFSCASRLTTGSL